MATATRPHRRSHVPPIPKLISGIREKRDTCSAQAFSTVTMAIGVSFNVESRRTRNEERFRPFAFFTTGLPPGQCVTVRDDLVCDMTRKFVTACQGITLSRKAKAGFCVVMAFA